MTVTLELSSDVARCLSDHLARHIAEVAEELVHTERRQMRHELAVDVESRGLIGQGGDVLGSEDLERVRLIQLFRSRA